MIKKMENKIKYIIPREEYNNKSQGRSPKNLIAVTETGTWFLHIWFNEQAYADASEIGWGEYNSRPFLADVFKLKQDVKIDLDKITCETFWNICRSDCKQVNNYNLEGRYKDIREEFEMVAQ